MIGSVPTAACRWGGPVPAAACRRYKEKANRFRPVRFFLECFQGVALADDSSGAAACLARRDEAFAGAKLVQRIFLVHLLAEMTQGAIDWISLADFDFRHVYSPPSGLFAVEMEIGFLQNWRGTQT